MIEINLAYKNPSALENVKSLKQTPISEYCSQIEKTLSNEYYVFSASNEDTMQSRHAGASSHMMLTDVHAHSKYYLSFLCN